MLHGSIGSFFISYVAVPRIIRVDPFSKGNALGEAVGYTHMSVKTITFPMIVMNFIFIPEAMLLVLAIGYCLDFYVMTCLFGSRIFGLYAAICTVAVTLVWFAWPQLRVPVIPVILALAYLVNIILLPSLSRQWLNRQAIVGWD